MKKAAIILSFLILSISVSGMFYIKFMVQSLTRDLAELNTQYEQERESMKVLKAEWAYLNEPQRLRNLAQKYLGLEKVKLAQIRNLHNGVPLYLAEDQTKKLAEVSYGNKNKNTKAHNINRNGNGLVQQVRFR